MATGLQQMQDEKTKMRQTRKTSALESVANILIGYSVNLAANFTIFPLFGWELSLRDNLTIGVFYTLVSFVRNYSLRRIFNRFSLFLK